MKWDRAVEGNRRGGNNRRVQEEAAGGDKGRKEAGENSLSEYSRHADTMPNIYPPIIFFHFKFLE